MTENEAIKEIKCWTETLLSVGSRCTTETAEAQEMAIKALEEVQQYRKIGTPEECRAAVEKQTARRSLHQGCYDKDGVWHEWNGINGKPYELCPSCGVNLCCMMPINKKPNYCKECGQKLDWNRRANDGETD